MVERKTLPTNYCYKTLRDSLVVFGRVECIRNDDITLVESNDQVFCARRTKHPVTILAVSPRPPAIFNANAPWRPKHGAYLILGRLSYLDFRDSGNRKGATDIGATCKAKHQKYRYAQKNVAE